jgi:isopenicillin-N N-acyltransferase-like protein
MTYRFDRRQFLGQAAASGLALAGGAGLAKWAAAADEKSGARGEIAPLTVISGKPRDRGRMYGSHFKDAIHGFLDREIYQAFIQKPSPKDEMLRYAGACGKEIRRYTPIIYDELEGMAEGAGLDLEEVLLITAHEELYHRGVLPAIEHCTALAAGPPDTADGNTYVGQTWDWMDSVFGLSSMLHWKRDEGPSLLSYAFPGLWVGAGLNSAGLALCWTYADSQNKAARGPRVGIPDYVLLAHLMYQESLDAVEEEARRANNAGWFTFVMADGQGHLLNIEGSPRGLVVERAKGRLARNGFGTRQTRQTLEGDVLPLHPRSVQMNKLLTEAAGKIDLRTIQHFLQDPSCGICVDSTIDMMVYNTTGREAWLSRGPRYGVDWKRFTFD